MLFIISNILVASPLLDNGLECFYCQANGGEEGDKCSSDAFGVPVPCQISDSQADHYGDVCAVGHTGWLP